MIQTDYIFFKEVAQAFIKGTYKESQKYTDAFRFRFGHFGYREARIYTCHNIRHNPNYALLDEPFNETPESISLRSGTTFK